MNYIEIKNYLFKIKEVDISENNKSLNFNNQTSNLKEHPLKSLRIKVKEHPSKILIVESQG
jgi:hypothetical protein